jgi:hypothetical protein
MVASAPPRPFFQRTRSNVPPSQFDVFTGGKLPEFTVFYNMAYFRMAGVVNHLLGNKYESNKDKLETQFTEWLAKTKDDSDEKVFAGLRDYIWKGFKINKNSSGNVLTQDDKDLIIELLTRLCEIRNFQSHIYHDNCVLVFSEQLKKRISDLHDDAALSFMNQYPNEVDFYEGKYKERPFFGNHNNQFFITSEGKTFFLSFFLTRGEMSRFLQQRKGSKRNDSSDFKIKHQIYCYYTHRDGAARQHYGQDENVFKGMTAVDQKEIMSARQAFKLISYLNDVPPVCLDVDLFPLFLNDKKVETTQDYIDFYKAHDLFGQEAVITPLVKSVKKDKNNKRSIEMIDVEIEHFLNVHIYGYNIHVSKTTFHKLILDAIRKNNKGESTIDKFTEFVNERKYLHKLITNDAFKTSELAKSEFTLEAIFNEYNRYKLRNDKLQEKFGKWLNKVEKKNDYESETFIELLTSKPIEVNYHNFYYEEDCKPRAIDMFSRFVVQYLIDFKKVEDWQWMFETFEIVSTKKEVIENGKRVIKDVQVNKRSVFFDSKMPEKGRLSVTDDGQVTLGMTSPNGNFYRFVLGNRALKNLLIADNQGKNINDFFKPILEDIDTIKLSKNQIIDFSGLKVLTEKDVPMSFKLAMSNTQLDINDLKDKAKMRIKLIIDELTAFTTDEKIPLSRNAKNRQIMRCYTFFPWVYEHDSKFKFLRKDEYKRMSVYHYCLQIRKNKDLIKGDFSFLLKDVSNNIDILPHTPEVVKSLLKTCNSIDELLKATAIKTIGLLTDWYNSIDNYNEESLQDIFGKLSISTYRNGVNLPDTTPFNIHPALVLRVFYADKIGDPTFSLAKSIWENPNLRRGLKNEYYCYKPYLKILGDNHKTVKKYTIGVMNELRTEDTLLWQLAKNYLNITSPAYQTILNWNQKNEDWQISNLRNTRFLVPYFNVKIKINNTETILNKLFLSIKFHQLDDYLLIESKDVIEKGIKQVVMRFNDASKNAEIKKWDVTKDNKGYTIPYEEVFKEIQRVFNDSVYWAKFILDWEKKVINDWHSNDRLNLEQTALGNSTVTPYLSFVNIGDKSNIPPTLFASLREVRNKAFHADIPEGWAYWQKENDTALCQLIGYTPKPLFDYENRNENLAENEV